MPKFIPVILLILRRVEKTCGIAQIVNLYSDDNVSKTNEKSTGARGLSPYLKVARQKNAQHAARNVRKRSYLL